MIKFFTCADESWHSYHGLIGDSNVRKGIAIDGSYLVNLGKDFQDYTHHQGPILDSPINS